MKAPVPTPPPSARDWPAGWLWAALVLLCLAAYWPALDGGLLWDDGGHVTREDLRPLGGLFRIWFEIGATQQYYPVLHSAFWLEHRLWGDATVGYHLLNVLLHATAAAQLAVLLRRLQVPGATLAALLFALHPVCVESVAWISEQKNTLSAVFYLAAALAWLRFDADRRPRHYALATAWFLLALLTKTVTATLPAALLVVAWWRRGRLDWRRDILPLLPWFAAGAAAGLFTARFERELIGAQGADFALGFADRVVLAGRVFWFYLGSLAWPTDLMFIYPRWTISAADPRQWLPLAAGLSLLAILVGSSRRSRGPLAAALLFAGTLFPVLGFFNVYPFVYSYVADHFQYLASLAVFALAGAGLHRLATRLPRPLALGFAVILLTTLGTLSFWQSRMYRDVFTLYETTLARNPAAWMAHHNLALALTQTGRVEEAITHLDKVLQLRPDYAPAENNLGNNLIRLGRLSEAVPHLERAIRLQPGYVEACSNLGNALIGLDRSAEAVPVLELAVQLRPDYTPARRNLGLALAMLGRNAEALAHFEAINRLNPDDDDAEMNRAIALMLLDRFPEAIGHFEHAIALAPSSAEHRLTYGRALAHQGRPAEAARQLEAALALNPHYAEAHAELARVYRQLGRPADAARHAELARQPDPSTTGNR